MLSCKVIMGMSETYILMHTLQRYADINVTVRNNFMCICNSCWYARVVCTICGSCMMLSVKDLLYWSRSGSVIDDGNVISRPSKCLVARLQ